MSYRELVGWQKYLAEEPANSIEIQLALLSQLVSSFGGGKHKITDFLITQYDEKKHKATEPTFTSEEEIIRVFSLMSKQS